jgi:hypothetical protein
MPSKLDDLLPAIINAGDSGLSAGKITEKFAGKSKTKDRLAELRDKLAALVRGGAIRGPLKHGATQYYFAVGHGPSIETASEATVALIVRSGVKLLSKAGLEKKVTGMNKRFFADGIKHAVANQAIVELSCGSSKYYLHRDVAADYFGFEVAGIESARPPQQPRPPEPKSLEPSHAPSLTLEKMLPAYRRLRAEQGGFSAVKIFDLMHALNGSKEDLHRLLIDETKAGRVTIHPTTTVNLPKEEIEAGIRLPGFPEPFVTVVVRNEP